MSGPACQSPELVYAALAATGADRGLAWVEPTPRQDAPAYSFGAPRRGRPTLCGLNLAAQLPSAALDGDDRPSAWEGLTLLLAPAEWAVAARGLSWTPLSPQPALLERLVAVYGVPRALHRGDPAALARLAAGLPAWRQRRGTLSFAADVLAAVERSGELDCLTPRPAPARVVLRGGARAAAQVGALRVQGGFVCHTDAGPAETLTLPPKSAAPLDRALLRLLPVWATLGASAESSP